MIPRVSVPDELREVALGQAGAMSRGQILGFGISDDVIHRLVRSGAWRRLAHGIYADAPDTWQQRVWAGLLIAGEDAVVGLRAAARLWNLPLDKPRHQPEDSPVEIYVGRTHRALTSTSQWRFIRADRVGQSNPPRTSIAQTIVDLAQTLSGDQLASLVGQSVSQRRVSADEILACLDAMGRHKQRTLLAGIVSDAKDG